jgi:hypothetical protein
VHLKVAVPNLICVALTRLLEELFVRGLLADDTTARMLNRLLRCVLCWYSFDVAVMGWWRP